MTKGIKIGQGGIDLTRNASIKYLKITGQQIFHYSDNSYKTTPKPETITLKATLYNINLLGNNKIRWYYATDKDKWIEFPETNARVATNTSEFTIPHDHTCWEEATTLTIKAEVEYLGKIYNDEFTLAKLAQGSDAYTVLLKDESQVFPTDDRGNYDVNELRALCATELYVYKGITPLKYETQFTVSQTSASNDTLAVDIEGEYHGSSVRIVPKELRADKCSAQLMITIDDKLNPSTEATKTRLTKSMSITKGKAGKDGESAQVVKITGDNIFKKENNIFTPNKITLTALLQNIDIQSRALGGRWYYSTDRATWKECSNYEISESDSFSMINIYPNSPGFTNNLIYYKYEISESLFDLVSVGKISDGLDGVGYSVFLSNDSENIPTDSLGNISADYLGENGKTFTEVEVYRSEGNVITQLTPTASSSIGKNEFKISILNNQSPQNIALVSSSQPNKVYLHTLSSDSKNFEIQIKLADGQTFTKVFTVVKSKQGYKGDQGLQGLQGPKGDQGIPGNKGDDGRTSYFHIKYSEFENPTLPEHISDIHNKYIGTYVDFNEMDDPNPLRYTWRRFEGIQGEQGIPGTDGDDGRTSYLHIKYSNDGGKTFTSNNGEDVGDYIGQYTDFEEYDKLDVKLYKWSKIKGEKGEQGIQGLQGLQGPQGIQGIPGLPGDDGRSSYFHIKYSPIENPTNPSDMTEEPSTYIGTYVDDIEEDSNDPRRYKWARLEGIQGPQGEQGVPGKTGDDGKTSYLHIKYSNDGGKTFTPNNGEDVGAYLGQYVDFVAQDSNDVKRYKWTKIVGETGPQGPQGPAGESGNLEDFPDTLPSKPVLKGKCIGFNSVDLSWTYENKIYYTYEVYASQTSGFTPSSSNVIFKGQGSAFLHNVAPEQTWYYKARAINTHGRATAYSDQITVRTVKIDDLSNYVNDAAIGNALIGELSFDRAWAGTLKGHYIDAKNLSVTDGNGKKTLDIDSYGNVKLNVSEFHLTANATSDVPTKTEVADDIKNSIDNVQVGVRNILRNSDFSKGIGSSHRWSISHGAKATLISADTQEITFSQYADKCARVEVATGQTYGYMTQTHILKKDTTYTISAWIYGATNKVGFGIYYNNGGWQGVGRKGIDTTQIGKWTRLSFTFKPNQTILETICCIGINGGVAGDVCYIMLPKLEVGNKATDWSPAPEDINQQLTSIKTDLQTQVDGKIDTWSQETPDPASSWTTSDEKLKHKGDIWYKPTSKETYRYTGTSWERLYDKVAENATNIANQKRRVFVSTPTTPYDVGDLWINNEELYRCKTALSSGSYNSGHWVKAVKYTDDSVAQSAKNDLEAFKKLDEWLVINNELDTYFPFDNNLQTTGGVNPNSGYNAYLIPQGKFGNCLSVQEDVVNLFAFNNISELNVLNNVSTLVTTKVSKEEVVCKYTPSSSTGLGYRGKDITVDTQRTYTLSGWMYVSENYDSTSAPAIIGEKGFAKNMTYDMNKKGQWQFFSHTMKPSSETARILLYPRTNSSVENATTGYVLYKNVQFTQTGAVHMFYNGTKPKDTVSYEVSQPDVSTMMAYKKHVLDLNFKHQALVKNGSTFTFYENGVATTNYVNKWRVYTCEGITTPGTDGQNIDKYNKPLSTQLTTDLTGIHHSWQTTGYGYVYRTFLYCSQAKTVTLMINFDNAGCAYCNGVLAGKGGYNVNGNRCVFNLVKGWNCIELANVDGDTGGRLSYVASGSDGLFSNKTSHPEILYMTAELPIEMANNKVTYFSRANCFVDEAVFLNKTITQEEVKTYVGSGKRLTDPARIIDVPEPTNVTFSFS